MLNNLILRLCFLRGSYYILKAISKYQYDMILPFEKANIFIMFKILF